ncbi:FtsX-like permease family protein [Faecalibacterium sp. An121]|uniref:FtsX-like permease family protein n=1 Tax=Faecalibacterium sp. An121 TaxID=1965550 RepID=UPI001FA82011|nr:FtsX-like permease family protein [Faecalibacterium sp. An121]
MKKTYRKNMWRELAANKSRFASLFGIVLLGVMMLSGLLSVAPGMRRAGQTWYAQQNVFDIRVVSTLGLGQSDIDAIAAVEGVEAVMPVKSVDCEGSYRGGSTLAIRVQQLPVYPTLQEDANMNRLVLEEGRLPESAGECAVQVLDQGAAGSIRLGDVITFSSGADDLSTQTLTVVGFVTDPLYFSTETESTTAGNGALGLAAYVADGSLTMDYYTTCYIKAAGAGQYDNDSDEYQNAVQAVMDRLEAIADTQARQRRQDLIQQAQDQLDDARAEFEQQAADAEAQLADAQDQLDEAKAQLEAGEAEYQSGTARLEAQKAALPGNMASGADQLVAAQAQVLDFEAQLEQIKQLVTLKGVADPLLGYAEDILHNAETALEEAEPDDVNYVELRDILNRAQALYDSTYQQLADYQAQLDAGKQQMYAQGLISSPNLSNEELVAEAEAALRRMKLQVLEGQLALNTGNAEAFTAFDAAQAQLEAARQQLDEGWQQYQEGAAAFETQKAQAEAQLADARRQLADAEEQVDDIASGEWYVLDRNSVVSIVFFGQNADRIESIARVFPVFFFLVAALVASTTMTRMVEENRTQMGTFKALGYTDREITAKYLVYGTTAGLLGCIAGMLLGFFGVPSVIWWAYSTVFDLPTFRLRVYPLLAVLSVVISIGVVGLTTLAACRVSLREKPAALLLPRAPAAGKRIFLERVKPLWRRMSFSQKTTARNMFRYKKRFYMTVLGVAGCTALLLIGFGLQDSIVEIVSRQYGSIQKADLSISLSSDKALELEGGLTDTLAARDEVESWGAFYTRTVTVAEDAAGAGELSVTLVAAQEPQKLTEYFTLQNGGSPLTFTQGSVVLSEKTAELLGVEAGDTVWVQGTGASYLPLTLTGVTENYLGAYLYVTQETLEALVDSPAWNTVYAVTSCSSETQRQTLSTVLLGCNYVSSTAFTADSAAMYDSTIACINYVVLLIIVCAAALAAVVLYNLISVNIGERKKELATIKVLGFFDKEVYRYIFREIELLSVIGAAVGLAIGAPMHQFVIRTVESEQMMFIRSLEPTSFVYSVALTLLFTVAVCRMMRRQVRAISMVESMKAPE